MADPLVFNPYKSWVDVVNDNQVPAGARPVAAADLLRYENLGEQAVARLNDHELSIQAQTAKNTAQDVSINAVDKRVTDLVNVAAQYNPTTALTTAIPTTSSVINSALTAAFKAPPSGRVVVEMSMFVRVTTKGKLSWIVANSASPFAAVAVNIVLDNVFEGYISTRRLITGLTAEANYSWQWRHLLATPGVGNLQIASDQPALFTVRAA